MFRVLKKIIPASFKKSVRLRLGVPDIFFSLERLRSLGFDPEQIVDVGAFEGSWTASCIKIFPEARFLMIEAISQKESKLKAFSERHNKVEYEIQLLGSADGKDVLFTELETASSVLEEKVANHTRVKRKTTSLSTVIKRHNISKIDLLKLDVQGYELEVLKGYEEFLPVTEVVLAEASLLDIHKGVPLMRDVIDFMGDRGFVVYDICSVSTRRPLDKALWQTDLLFVRENSMYRSDKRYNV